MTMYHQWEGQAREWPDYRPVQTGKPTVICLYDARAQSLSLIIIIKHDLT